MMKGLSLTQPWASLVALGKKRIETRSWRTDYRGWVAIHAAKGLPGWARDLVDEYPFDRALSEGGIYRADQLPRGSIVALARLVACVPTQDGPRSVHVGGRSVPFPPDPASDEWAFGDYSPGRFGFCFTPYVKPLPEPIPWRGALGLWDIPEELEHRLFEAIGHIAQEAAHV